MLRPDTMALTALLALLTAFGPVATDMYVPSLPDIGGTFAASTSEVQLTLSSYLVGFAIGQMVYGPVADRYGRKPILLAALILFCAASVLCAFAPNVETLIAARTLQALGGSGAVILPRAIVRDLYAGERAGRELSRIGAIMSLAPVIAPLLGGAVHMALGWRTNFVIIVAIGAAAFVVVWRSLPETLRPTSGKPMSFGCILRNCQALIRHREFLIHLSIATWSYAGLFAWISGSSFVLQGLYGLSALQFGVMYAAACGGGLLGGAVAASVVMRMGLTMTIGLGSLTLALGGVAMIAGLALGASPVASLVLAMALYHAGLMIAMPLAMAGAMMPFPSCAGTACSLVGGVQQIAAALVGAAVGWALGTTAWPLVAAIALMGLLSLAGSAVLLWMQARGAIPAPYPTAAPDLERPVS
jgi:DHA1 family bicyclomycin/chloramphenicol resistance-like MFS transporter